MNCLKNAKYLQKIFKKISKDFIKKFPLNFPKKFLKNIQIIFKSYSNNIPKNFQ